MALQSQLYRNSRESRIFDSANLIFLTIVTAGTLYPLIYVVVTSLNRAYVPNHFLYLWPEQPQLVAYQVVIENQQFLRSFMNSVVYAVSGSLLSIALTMTTAYPLSIRSFPFRNIFMFFITFTLLFSGGLIPFYLVVRTLGLIDTPWAMIIPGSLSAFNVILARTYFQASIPNELREAAKVDGAGDWTILIKIVFPLSTPIVAVIGLFSVVGIWNSYFNALIFLNDERLFPVSLILRDIVVGATQPGMVPTALATVSTDTSLRAATLVVAMLPILLVYPFLQRYFVKGIMIGAIKG